MTLWCFFPPNGADNAFKKTNHWECMFLHVSGVLKRFIWHVQILEGTVEFIVCKLRSPEHCEDMTLFSRSLRNSVHVFVLRHYNQCCAMLQCLEKNSLGWRGKDKNPAKHATCCSLLPGPFSVITHCVSSQFRSCHCIRVYEGGRGCHLHSLLTKCVQRDSERKSRRRSPGCCRCVCLCLCVKLNTCECDWLISSVFINCLQSPLLR